MGFKLLNDKLGALSHSAGVITIQASILTIGGQQYATAAMTRTISADVTMTANNLYMIYAVVSSGVVQLRISSSVNSVGPAGFTSWQLVGAFYSDGLAVIGFGSFVNITGVPESRNAWASLCPAHGNWTNITTTTSIYRRGGWADINQFLNFTGAAGTGQLLPQLPAQIVVDSGKLSNGSRFPLGHGSGPCGSGGAGASVYSFPVNSPSGSSYEPLALSNAPGAAVTGVQPTAPATWQAGNYINMRLHWPVLGWSNTQLVDL